MWVWNHVLVLTLWYVGLVPGVGTHPVVCGSGARCWYSPCGMWVWCQVLVLTLWYVGLVPGVDPAEGRRRCGRRQQGHQLGVA